VTEIRKGGGGGQKQSAGRNATHTREKNLSEPLHRGENTTQRTAEGRERAYPEVKFYGGAGS